MPELLERTSLEFATVSPTIDSEPADYPGSPNLLEVASAPVAESPATLTVAETVDVDFTPSSTEKPTLRDRFFRSRIGRTALAAIAGLGFAAGASVVDAAPAVASETKTYTTTDDVWLHADPGLGDKGDLIKIIPKGTKFTADCYVNDTPIGERNNPAWLHGTDETGATGYFTDYYSDSRWSRDNTLHDQGLAFCGEKTEEEQPSGQPEGEVLVTPIYDREKAVAWAGNTLRISRSIGHHVQTL